MELCSSSSRAVNISTRWTAGLPPVLAHHPAASLADEMPRNAVSDRLELLQGLCGLCDRCSEAEGAGGAAVTSAPTPEL